MSDNTSDYAEVYSENDIYQALYNLVRNRNATDLNSLNNTVQFIEVLIIETQDLEDLCEKTEKLEIIMQMVAEGLSNYQSYHLTSEYKYLQKTLYYLGQQLSGSHLLQ